MPVIINGSNTPTAGSVTYGDGTQYANTAAGTAGQVLLSNGAAAPTWGTAGASTTATNLAGGSNGTVPYQSAAGTTQMLAAGTSGQSLLSSGAGAPTWGTPALATSATSATTATNLAGGSNGTIPYQSAAGTTQMLAVGTSGQVLKSNGAAAPSWITPAGGFTTMQVFESSGTFTVPAGITTCKVTVTGGGGGSNGSACGGGAGGTSIRYVTLSGGSATITIGSGSTSTGGDSSFVYGATTLTGFGGGAGANNSFSTGGDATGGTLNIRGGYGTYVNTPAGFGAASIYGGSAGNNSGNNRTWGAGGLVYSSGGSTVSRTGSDGLVVIEY